MSLEILNENRNNSLDASNYLTADCERKPWHYLENDESFMQRRPEMIILIRPPPLGWMENGAQN